MQGKRTSNRTIKTVHLENINAQTHYMYKSSAVIIVGKGILLVCEIKVTQKLYGFSLFSRVVLSARTSFSVIIVHLDFSVGQIGVLLIQVSEYGFQPRQSFSMSYSASPLAKQNVIIQDSPLASINYFPSPLADVITLAAHSCHQQHSCLLIMLTLVKRALL